MAEASGARVLVADDDDDLRPYLMRLLASAGHTVSGAADGETALRRVREDHPDLVLLDVSLPGLDGFAVCRALQADPDGPAVIFLSAHGETDSRVTGLEAGAVDYVVKPFIAAELRARIDAALRTKALRDTLSARAVTDPLTGLPNRRHLDDRTVAAIAQARRLGMDLAFLIVDVDHFKRVNDTYGHLAGDEVLREVALRISGACRVSDTPARYGGEEFAVVLPDTDGAGALAAGERVRRAIACRSIALPGGGSEIEIRASVGAAVLLATDATPADLFAAADEALYRAKDTGRDRVVLAGHSAPLVGSPSDRVASPAIAA